MKLRRIIGAYLIYKALGERKEKKQSEPPAGYVGMDKTTALVSAIVGAAIAIILIRLFHGA